MDIVKSILITLKASASASKVEFVSFNSFAFIYLPAGKKSQVHDTCICI